MNNVEQARMSFAAKVMAWLGSSGATTPATIRNEPSKREVLVALVVDDMRANPREWSENVGYSTTTMRSSKANITITCDSDYTRRPELYKDQFDAKIDGIEISKDDYKAIRHVFVTRYMDDTIERLVRKRLTRIGVADHQIPAFLCDSKPALPAPSAKQISRETKRIPTHSYEKYRVDPQNYEFIPYMG